MTATNIIKPKFSSRNMRKVTNQTLSLLAECLRDGDGIIDIGCGNGYALWQIEERCNCSEVVGTDIVDIRRAPVPEFFLYDGRHIPVEDNRFDIAMLNFVLHHLPNDEKGALIEEARRVSKRCLFILEDTPMNSMDRFFSRRHGEAYRDYIGNDGVGFGFYTKEEWEQLFEEMGFKVETSRRLGRFSRQWKQPYARSVFILGV
jgi:ubiquinone/menaquinone biosynthesis C-methylase UbiE